MANIFVGSPRFESTTMGTGKNSVLLELYIDNVLRYSIIKNATQGTVVTFEISELVRDYINIVFTGTYVPQTVFLGGTRFKQYTGQNGTGNASVFTLPSVTALNGYGTFMEGVNPEYNQNVNQWLISKDPIKNGYYIYVPEGQSGVVPASGGYTGNNFAYEAYGSNDISISPFGTTLNIVRINCSRYTRDFSNSRDPKITFVNKYGFLQDLFFFLKSVKTITSTKETFNSNTINTSSGSATYSVTAPTKTVFNKSANQKIVLNSGYYPEGANDFFEQLLLSKQIWLTQPKPSSLANAEIVPVIISTSSMTYKTSLNEKLIEYTMEFDMAFDYINNVR